MTTGFIFTFLAVLLVADIVGTLIMCRIFTHYDDDRYYDEEDDADVVTRPRSETQRKNNNSIK